MGVTDKIADFVTQKKGTVEVSAAHLVMVGFENNRLRFKHWLCSQITTVHKT